TSRNPETGAAEKQPSDDGTACDRHRRARTARSIRGQASSAAGGTPWHAAAAAIDLSEHGAATGSAGRAAAAAGSARSPAAAGLASPAGAVSAAARPAPSALQADVRATHRTAPGRAAAGGPGAGRAAAGHAQHYPGRRHDREGPRGQARYPREGRAGEALDEA